MDLTPRGRDVVGSVALLIAGFALGSVSAVNFTTEQALAILASAGGLLVLAARRGRNHHDEDEREEREEHERE